MIDLPLSSVLVFDWYIFDMLTGGDFPDVWWWLRRGGGCP